jgi:hypothetical protein
MPLSDEEYAHVSALLGSGVARAHGGPERRDEERAPARGPAQLTFDAVGPGGGGSSNGLVHGAAHNAAAGGGGAAGGATRATTRCVTVYIHNVSSGGLGLFAGTSLQIDAPVELRLTGRGSGPQVSLRCTVRHCAALAPGLYGAGVNVVEYLAHPPTVDLGPSEASAAWTNYLNRDTKTSVPSLTPTE